MYVILGSASAAERFKRAVERVTGFPAYTVRTPAAIHSGGCSYSVKLDRRAADIVKKIAHDYGLSIKGIYTETTKNGRRKYDDLS